MNESRQQPRARERADTKAARRAQPPQDPAAAAFAPARRPHVLEARLSRFSFPDDEQEPVTWSAQWGLRDDAVGTEDGNQDVQQLICDIIADARRWTDRYDLSIEWELSGDAPHGETVDDVLSELGVSLPETVTPEPDSA